LGALGLKDAGRYLGVIARTNIGYHAKPSAARLATTLSSKTAGDL
jgi:hypothetical protein